MHTGKSYRLGEFIVWTRREIYTLLAVGAAPVALYDQAGWHWLAIPWAVVAMIGTATAFVVGFKNTQTYNRTLDAQQVWTSIYNASKAWGLMSRDYCRETEVSRLLVHRHLAWLTALRYQLRRSRHWETVHHRSNAEYRLKYDVPEHGGALDAELAEMLEPDELVHVSASRRKTGLLLDRQSRDLRSAYDSGFIAINFFIELEKAVHNFLDLQGKCERIKNFPYPRQYAVINSMFVWLFCLLLPLGLLKDFAALGNNLDGFMHGRTVWLVIPCSVVISWIYTSLERVGQSTENPFEGSANDVPISQMCRMIEIEMRQMLGETAIPSPLVPLNDIIL